MRSLLGGLFFISALAFADSQAPLLEYESPVQPADLGKDLCERLLVEERLHVNGYDTFGAFSAQVVQSYRAEPRDLERRLHERMKTLEQRLSQPRSGAERSRLKEQVEEIREAIRMKGAHDGLTAVGRREISDLLGVELYTLLVKSGVKEARKFYLRSWQRKCLLRNAAGLAGIVALGVVGYCSGLRDGELPGLAALVQIFANLFALVEVDERSGWFYEDVLTAELNPFQVVMLGDHPLQVIGQSGYDRLLLLLDTSSPSSPRVDILHWVQQPRNEVRVR